MSQDVMQTLAINAFIQLGNLLQGYFARLTLTQGIKGDIVTAIEQSVTSNTWFTIHNIHQALQAIANEMLNENHLKTWCSSYSSSPLQSPKDIGLIMAGNIPLVGFHDFLCTILAGHRAVVKLSSKDAYLLPMLAKLLCQIDYKLHSRIAFVDELTNVDAVIATGSNNAARYFEHQYGALPHIFRHNRTSVAVLRGDETSEQLHLLANDVCDYFGLGCRNVSKLYIPKGYDIYQLQMVFAARSELLQHPFYHDCYRYAKALHAIRKTASSYDFEVCVISYQQSLHSPIAELFVEEYHSEQDLQDLLLSQSHTLQCIATHTHIQGVEQYCVPLGRCQTPKLSDYADGVDTLQFLFALS
ncbi:MAG: acyl-CoA reductase [Bacteroidales bacterium]